MSAITEIGLAAGKLWQYLDKNGASTVAKATTDTGLGKNEIQRAIGWLAKENKLAIETKGRIESIALK